MAIGADFRYALGKRNSYGERNEQERWIHKNIYGCLFCAEYIKKEEKERRKRRERKTERERARERETDRQSDRVRDRQRQKEGRKDTQIDKERQSDI